MCPLPEDLACSPGVCPDQESNQWPTFWFTGWPSTHWATPARLEVFSIPSSPLTSWTWTGCPPVRFNFDTHYLELVHTTQINSIPQHCSTSDTDDKSLMATCTSDQPSTHGGCWWPCLGLGEYQNNSQNQENTFYLLSLVYHKTYNSGTAR